MESDDALTKQSMKFVQEYEHKLTNTKVINIAIVNRQYVAMYFPRAGASHEVIGEARLLPERQDTRFLDSQVEAHLIHTDRRRLWSKVRRQGTCRPSDQCP